MELTPPGGPVILLLLLHLAPALAAEGPAAPVGEAPVEAETRRLTVLPLPTLEASPELGFAAGAVALVSMRPFADTRPSQAEVELTLTTRKQLIADTRLDLFLPGEVGLVLLRAAVMRFPESYWGTGPETPDSAQETVDLRRLELALEPLWHPGGELYLGPAWRLQEVWGVVGETGGILDGGAVTGASGGTSSGLGLVALWEGRSNRLNPEAGATFALLRALVFGPATGSDFGFSSVELDGRAYLGLGEGVVALQLLVTSQGGDPPFRMLTRQGGDPAMRGTYEGRFRDLHLAATQAEVRQPLFWRLGVVGFGGLSLLAPTLAELPESPLRPSLGGGLRVRVDDQDDINLRLDLAWGATGLGAYFGFGEAF